MNRSALLCAIARHAGGYPAGKPDGLCGGRSCRMSRVRAGQLALAADSGYPDVRNSDHPGNLACSTTATGPRPAWTRRRPARSPPASARTTFSLPARTGRFSCAWPSGSREIAASPRMAETRRLWQRAQPAGKDPAGGLLRPGERLERDHHRGPDAVPGQAGPPLGDGPPQGDLLGRGDGRRQAASSPYFDVPYTVSADDWGLQTVYHRTESLGSCVWDAPIKDYDADLQEAARAPIRDRLGNHPRLPGPGPRRVRQGILPVRLKGIWWWSLGADLARRDAPRPAESCSATSSSNPTG